jgi:hypothetical protein
MAPNYHQRGKMMRPGMAALSLSRPALEVELPMSRAREREGKRNGIERACELKGSDSLSLT